MTPAPPPLAAGDGLSMGWLNGLRDAAAGAETHADGRGVGSSSGGFGTALRHRDRPEGYFLVGSPATTAGSYHLTQQLDKADGTWLSYPRSVIGWERNASTTVTAGVRVFARWARSRWIFEYGDCPPGSPTPTPTSTPTPSPTPTPTPTPTSTPTPIAGPIGTTPICQLCDTSAAATSGVGTFYPATSAVPSSAAYDVPGGQGDAIASWQFGVDPATQPGAQFAVSATWVPASNLASNSPFAVFDGPTLAGLARVDQSVAPAGPADGSGVAWQQLAVVTPRSGSVQVQLSNLANGSVVADQVRLQALTWPTCPFTLSATTADDDASIDQPSTATVSASSGYSGTVTLSVSGLPAGASATISGTISAASPTATITITQGAATANGSYTLTLTGVDGQGFHASTTFAAALYSHTS